MVRGILCGEFCDKIENTWMNTIEFYLKKKKSCKLFYVFMIEPQNQFNL